MVAAWSAAKIFLTGYFTQCSWFCKHLHPLQRLVRTLITNNIFILFILSYQDKDFFEECKKEYLKKREDYQMNYVQSGKMADMKKKETVIA